ncbi:MAG TPA: GNAT family N-acetyltransferase [Egicoccus sp.]|nr:GNAT family N-acetyltransferase [Egicoccus sp.]
MGIVALSLTPLLAGGGWWSRITALAVDPRIRRRGVAAALVAEAERMATDGGSRLMQLNCGRRPERVAAHEFYPAVGYRDQYDHHVLYEKRLDGPAG